MTDIDLNQQIAMLTRRLERERKGRIEAETLLESKSLALYRANTALQQLAEELGQRVRERTSELHDRERLLAEVQRIGHFGHWRWDSKSNTTIWSDELYRLYGYAPGEVTPSQDAVLIRLVPEERDHWQRRWFEAVESGAASYEIAPRLLLPDGRTRHLIETGRLIRDEDGRLASVIGVVQDVTTRVEADSRLALLADITRSIANLVVVVDSTGQITYASESVRSILGYEPAEIMGDGWWRIPRLLTPEQLADEREYVMRAARGEVVSDAVPHEHALRHKDGSLRWLLIADAKGPGDLVIGVCTDITDRKAAENALRENEQRFRNFVESAGDMIYRTDRDGRFTYANPVAMRIMGFTSESDFVGHRFLDFIRSDMRSVVRRKYLEQYVNRTQNTYFEIPVIASDGRELWMGQNVQVLVESDVVVGFQAVVRDLTERKIMEQRLAEAHDRALEGSRLKSEFLAMMSHEIRTPMNAVIGMNELLLESPLDVRQRELAEVALNSAQSLLSLINDILDFSKIEVGRMTMERVAFDIASVVAASVNIVKPKAQAKQLPLSASLPDHLPAHVLGDPGRLRQVLLNLLSNAVKFTLSGEVRLVVSILSSDDARLRCRFDVIDTGIGLSESARRRLFQPFVQADGSITRRYGGSGLGLAISRKLVELMGGDIGVESQEGAGTRFFFEVVFEQMPAHLSVSRADPQATLQLVTTETRVEIPQPVAPDSSTVENCIGATVLLVEDNPANQRLTTLQMKKIGFSVDLAANGVEALKMLRERSRAGGAYSLVLMDCQMPEMDGFTATREIRKLEAPSGMRTPIIAMTANAMRGDREACIEAGMDDYVSKPVRISALTEAVQRWMTTSVAPASAIDEATWRDFLSALDGRDQTASAVAAVYLEDLSSQLARLTEATRARDAGAARAIAQQIAAGSRFIGAARLVQHAADLDTAARAGMRDGLVAHTEILQSEFERVRAELQQRLAALHSVAPLTA